MLGNITLSKIKWWNLSTGLKYSGIFPTLMRMRTGPTNPELMNLIIELKTLAIQENKKIWKRVATDLEKPTRERRVVNLIRIDKNAKEDEIALIPGKVLAGGDLTKKTTIAAYQFSGQALDKINKIGKAITIKELMKQNPRGNKVRIIG